MTRTMQAEPPTESPGDFFTPEFVEDPYPTYRQLRESDPITFIEPLNAWILTAYEDVQAASTDDRFGVNYRDYQINRMGESVVEEKFFQSAQHSMVCNDPPDHTRMRRVFVRGFTAKRIRELPSFTARFANDCFDRVQDGRIDIIPDYSRLVPLAVLSHILGVPESDWSRMAEWVHNYGAVLEVKPMTAHEVTLANEAAEGLDNYFYGMIDSRRSAPQDDFVTEVIRGNAELEVPLTDAELASNLALVYFGGHDTQEKMFGNIVNALDANRGQLEFLAEDPQRVDSVMNELLRYDTPGQFMGRCPKETLEFRGKTMHKGQTVMLGFGAANHDPSVFADPEKLDFNRVGAPVPNLTFGAGRHRCIGATLAQQNLPIMLKVMLERCPDFRVNRSGVQRHMTLNRGFENFPIEWDQ